MKVKFLYLFLNFERILNLLTFKRKKHMQRSRKDHKLDPGECDVCFVRNGDPLRNG